MTRTYRKSIHNEQTGERQTRTFLTGGDPFGVFPYEAAEGWAHVGPVTEFDRAPLGPEALRRMEDALGHIESERQGRRVRVRMVQKPGVKPPRVLAVWKSREVWQADHDARLERAAKT